MRVLAYCLMPNHLHFVAWPRGDGDLARWMHWLLTTHVQHHHRRYGTNGRVWQGRYKAFAIQHDHHLLAVMRYVERNPLRANLVGRAEDWRWSSLAWRGRRRPPPRLLAEVPVALPDGWIGRVNEPITEAELASIRLSVKRSRPFGDAEWTRQSAQQLGLDGTLRELGRPRRNKLLRDYADV
jgi:putative transposase